MYQRDADSVITTGGNSVVFFSHKSRSSAKVARNRFRRLSAMEVRKYSRTPIRTPRSNGQHASVGTRISDARNRDGVLGASDDRSLVANAKCGCGSVEANLNVFYAIHFSHVTTHMLHTNTHIHRKRMCVHTYGDRLTQPRAIHTLIHIDHGVNTSVAHVLVYSFNVCVTICACVCVCRQHMSMAHSRRALGHYVCAIPIESLAY